MSCALSQLGYYTIDYPHRLRRVGEHAILNNAETARGKHVSTLDRANFTTLQGNQRHGLP